MSKPIIMSDAEVQRITAQIQERLRGMKLSDGKVNFSYSIDRPEEETTNLTFNEVAFTKMLALVNSFDSEVAWHGTAERTEDGFYISDLIVYPQTVTGATVNTDQKGYEEWLMALDTDDFNHLRMQGHSHVNMSVTPSSVDKQHQEGILNQLEADDFYIFIIWNKKMDRFIRIYDMRTNTLYETNDVHVFVGDYLLDDKEFLEEAKKLVKPSYSAATAKTPAKVGKKKGGYKDYGYGSVYYGAGGIYDDEDTDWFSRS